MRKIVFIVVLVVAVLGVVGFIGLSYYQNKIGKDVTESMVHRNSLDQYDDFFGKHIMKNITIN